MYTIKLQKSQVSIFSLFFLGLMYTQIFFTNFSSTIYIRLNGIIVVAQKSLLSNENDEQYIWLGEIVIENQRKKENLLIYISI